MNLNTYSDRAKQAIQSAQSLALAQRHQQFAPEHLLKVLLEEKDGLSRTLIGSGAAGAEVAVNALLEKTPKVEGGSGQLYLKPDTARVFATAEADANFVLTANGDIVEIQATGEKRGFTRPEFEALFSLAEKGIGELAKKQLAAVG